MDNLTINELKAEIEKLRAENKTQKQTINELIRVKKERPGFFDFKRGQIFEEQIGAELKSAFTEDLVKDYPKGNEQVPDFLQIIQLGEKGNEKEIGRIIYETKNAKWQAGWLKKLFDDVHRNDAKYGILIAADYDNVFGNVPIIESKEWPNIWITNPENFVFAAKIIRKLIVAENNYEQKFERYITNKNAYRSTKEIEDAFEKTCLSCLPIIDKQIKELERIRTFINHKQIKKCD